MSRSILAPTIVLARSIDLKVRTAVLYGEACAQIISPFTSSTAQTCLLV